LLDFITAFFGGISFIYTRFENTHEAIIDRETWDTAQRLRVRKHKRLSGGTNTHRLSGLVFCADCGSKMRYTSPEAKRIRGGKVYDSDSAFQCGGVSNDRRNRKGRFY